MNENWYVLAVAILTEKSRTVEQAFELYEKGKVRRGIKRPKEDIEDMLKLRNKLTIRELAEIYGTSRGGISGLISKYKKRAAATAQ